MRWLCACGSADIFAVKPGVKDQFWCKPCWLKVHRKQKEMER